VVLEPVGSDVVQQDSAVLRPPRFGEPLRLEEVDLPVPPKKQKPQPFPLVMMFYPLIFGASFFAGGTANWTSLGFIIGFPLLSVGTYYEQKRHIKKDFKRELGFWREDFDKALEDLDRHAVSQRNQSLADHPEAAELPGRVLNRHPALWNRREDSLDFLSFRIGIGPVPALLSGKLADGGERDVTFEARKEVDVRKVLDDLPVCVDLATVGLSAIVGPRDAVDATVRAAILRLCCDHSPADLSVAAILGPDRAHHETWIRWLPHGTRRIGGTASVAVGAADGQALLDRLSADEGGRGQTVCLVDQAAGLPRRAVAAVAAIAVERRLHVIWMGDGPDTAPTATELMVDLTASVSDQVAVATATKPDQDAPRAVAHLARRDRSGVQLITAVDQLSLGEAWRMARTMTSYIDDAAVLPADTALPDVVRLPELAPDVDALDSPTAVVERWQASRGLRAQIGAGVDGVVTLDLRDDGPHALVGGTTGSGKSELLQTLICSLALNNPPSRMTFLLVDYKGGAAFRECADLPHTVGYITDLNPALVKRALTSLSAEITAREELLGHYGVKDLIQLEREHPEAAPPSLLICCDEFAALTTEVPDFVDGMVNIAQRGRSLGMHMLLATQRPAGVVTANIRANTDLRIALRVSSTDDSNDIIDTPDAARISRRTPGRAWIRRTGHGTAELVQAAWVGAREEIANEARTVDVRPFSARADMVDDGAVAAPTGKLHPRTDLDRLVTAIEDAFVRSGRPRPKKPWLPPLPTELLLGCREPGELLMGAAALDEERVPGSSEQVHRVTGSGGNVPLGLVDRPALQSQPPFLVDYAQAGHLLVFGASGSGKTELLRTVAIGAALADPGNPPYVYGIDFGGGGLSGLEAWPAVGSIVGEQSIERVMRLLRMLKATVAERNQLLARAGAADLDALAAAGHRLPRLHVLIDNLISLLDTLDSGNNTTRKHGDMLASILTEGRRVGVHITATVPQRTGIGANYLAAFGQRLALRMTTDDDYGMIGVPNGVLTTESPGGRGLVGNSEVQVATVGGSGTPAQQERFLQLGELLTGLDERPPVPWMPSHVPYDVLPPARRDDLTVAVEADYVSAVATPLCGTPTLVFGRSRSGRTTMLAGVAGLARRSEQPPAEIVLFGANAAAAPLADHYDTVLTSLDDVASWLPDWAARVGADGPGAWRLLLIDDLHLWEREWSAGRNTEVMDGFLALLSSPAAANLALVAVADTDEARSNMFNSYLLTPLRKSRRGVLLQPDYADGQLLNADIPLQSVEPLVGTGRGLWCAAGNTMVVQVVSVPNPNGSQ
jgi:S-DNA-T family DNA segregation ATPase FtsK/SpoIIIE